MSIVLREFSEIQEKMAEDKVIALDLETGGLSPWNSPIHVIAIYGPASDTIGILHYPRGRRVPREVLQWLAQREEIVTHNGVQFDIPFLANAGMEWDKPYLYDTMIGEQSVLEVDRRDIKVNLKDTTKRHLGKVLDKAIDHGSWGLPELTDDALRYVTGDISYILELQRAQKAKGEERDTLRCIEFEMALAKPVLRMSLNGLPIDLNELERFFNSRSARHEETDAFLRKELGDINFRSFPQLQTALLKRFGEGFFPDTRAERLMEYTRTGGDLGAISEALLAWRNFKQRESMFSPEWRTKYVVDSPSGPRVHGRFWQVGTNTGRFSSAEPNLQQIPRDMRTCFGNHEGWAIGKTDYAAIEVRIAASLAEDAVMIQAFNDGEDIHRLVASAGFNKPPEAITSEERRIAKAMSFTLLFGGGVETFRAYARANGSDIEESDALRAVDNFFAKFDGIRNMREAAIRRADSGYPLVIIYPTGLRRLLRGDQLRATTILNNRVQGSAAAGMKKALLECEKSGIAGYLSAVVHDELVYTAPINEIEELRREVDQCMIRGMKWALEDEAPINIQVESSWGPTWASNPDTLAISEG